MVACLCVQSWLMAMPVVQSSTHILSYVVDKESLSQDQQISFQFVINVTNPDLSPYEIHYEPSSSFSSPMMQTVEWSQVVSFIGEGMIRTSTWKGGQMVFVYENPAPAQVSQELVFNLTLTIPMNHESGFFREDARFLIQSQQMTVADLPLALEVNVPQVSDLSILNEESEVIQFMDFGLVDPNIPQVKKKLKIIFDSNVRIPYRILARKETNIKSDLGYVLRDDFLHLQLLDKNINGQLYSREPFSLPEEDQLLFQSNASGDAQMLELDLWIHDPARLYAGIYKSFITFFVESGKDNAEFPTIVYKLNFTLQVQKKFFFNATPVSGDTLVKFIGDPLNDQFSNQLVKIDIFSNLGQPYTFYHGIPEGLTHIDGGEILFNQFKYRVLNTEGTARNEEWQELSSEGRSIYDSIDPGNAFTESFIIDYRLSWTPSPKAGSYRSNIKYELATT